MTEGKKNDEGKLPWDLLPWQEVEDVVRVLQFGAEKYDANSWQHIVSAKDRYFAAAIRHIIAYRKGEKIDPESNLPHLAHAACNMLFLAWFDNNPKVD